VVNVGLAQSSMLRQLGGMEPPLPLHEMLHQVQEEDLPPAMDAVGWKNK
jgi:hypothetical protein